MARLASAEEALAREITALSRTATSRITRLSPALRSAFGRLLAGAENKALATAAERYLVAARRVEAHSDAAAKAVFQVADGVLATHLGGVAGRDAELLRRELAQRRLFVLEDPTVLEERFRAAVSGRRGHLVARLTTEGADLYAAVLQHGFFQRIREVMAIVATERTEAQQLLVSARRKFATALGSEWAAGWEPVFAYMREHAVDLAASGRWLREAEDALAAASKLGTTAEIREATSQLRNARQQANGYLSKVKGLLGEAYAPRWKDWLVQLDGFMEVAGREIAARSGRWEVRRVVGDLRIDGREAWDEAILLLRTDVSPNRAELFLAAQYKVEKEVTALQQIENDVVRETNPSSLPVLTFRDGGSFTTVPLTPTAPGKTSHRYLFNASGGRIGPASIGRLRRAGIEVQQMNLDVTIGEFDVMSDTLLRVATDIVR